MPSPRILALALALALACPLVGSPAPDGASTSGPIAPLPRSVVPPLEESLSEVAPAPATCQEIADTARRAARDPALGEKDANALYAHVHGAAREPSCADQLARLALELPCETHAIGVVVSGLVSRDSFPASSTRPLVARAGEREACLKEILPSVQHAWNVDLALARSVREIALRKDENAVEAGFFALGSLGLTARRGGAPDVVALVEKTLSAELRKRDGRRLVLLEAAGNAACESCEPELERALHDGDPWVRRAAAASFRFRGDRRSVSVPCAVIDRDSEKIVREHAAWSLAFGDSHADARAACLSRAASEDPDLDVRRTATRSLTLLPQENAAADRALLALAREPNPPNVRLIALEHLAASDPTPLTESTLP